MLPPPPITDSSKMPSSNRVEEKVGLSAGVYTQGGAYRWRNTVSK